MWVWWCRCCSSKPLSCHRFCDSFGFRNTYTHFLSTGMDEGELGVRGWGVFFSSSGFLPGAWVLLPYWPQHSLHNEITSILVTETNHAQHKNFSLKEGGMGNQCDDALNITFLLFSWLASMSFSPIPQYTPDSHSPFPPTSQCEILTARRTFSIQPQQQEEKQEEKRQVF